MKKNYIVYLGVFLLACNLALFQIGCTQIESPPSIESVQNHYQEHREDIQIIINIFTASNYEHISIRNNDGTMLADLNIVSIDDKEVFSAVDSLLANGAYHHIIKNENTIYLLQWKGIRDIGCGIAYSINRVDNPQIEFETQLVPLSDDGWFYYVSDYNTWQSEQ